MFWAALIFFLVAVGGLIGLFFARDRFAPAACLIIGGVIGAILLVVSMASIVPTRNVGIVVQFGKPTDRTTGAGLQWTSPIQGIEDWDATAKAYDHSTKETCVQVRIAGGGSGCVELTVGWRAAVPRSPENFAAFRPEGDLHRFDVFTNRRVNTPINAEVLGLFSTFDPFQGVTSATVGSGGLPPSPDLNKLYRQALTDRLNLAVGGGTLAADGKTVTVQKDNPSTRKDFEDDPEADVVVLSVTFGFIWYDDSTNAKLASYGQKLLDGRNIAVDKVNAAARAQVASDTGVPAAVQQCLDLIKVLGKGEPGLCMGSSVALTRNVG